MSLELLLTTADANVSQMRSLLSTRNIKTPAAWWSNASTARLPSFSHKARSSPALFVRELFVREERTRADALSAALINKCRASGKLAPIAMRFCKRMYIFMLEAYRSPPRHRSQPLFVFGGGRAQKPYHAQALHHVVGVHLSP